MQREDFKQVSLFFIITLFLSYFVFWGPIAIFKVQTVNLVDDKMGPLWAIILFVTGGFVPSIIGITLTAFYEGKSGVLKLLKKSTRINLGIKWYAFIIIISLYFGLALIVIYNLLGGRFDFSQFWVQLPTIIPLIFLGPLSEEYGWRGFAIKRLLRNVSPNTTSLVIGLVWSLWHLPLFFIPGSSQFEFNLPFLVFLISVTSISFVFTYFYIRTGQSIFSAIFLHWIYTYVIQVVNSTVIRTSTYNWLEFIPALLMGIIFIILMWNGLAKYSVKE